MTHLASSHHSQKSLIRFLHKLSKEAYLLLPLLEHIHHTRRLKMVTITNNMKIPANDTPTTSPRKVLVSSERSLLLVPDSVEAVK